MKNTTKTSVKKTLKSALKTAMLAGLIASPICYQPAAQAKLVDDIQPYMHWLLGHDAKVTNIFKINEMKLESGRNKFEPWAGSYWPDITGGITNHYRARNFLPQLRAQILFGMRYNTARDRFVGDHENVCSMVTPNPKDMEWDNETMNASLSPTEKYDLLLGDLNFTFSRRIMQEMDFRSVHRMTTKKIDGSESDTDGNPGDNATSVSIDQKDKDGNLAAYAKYDKEVEYRYWRDKGDSLAYWSGICDGWAPASFYLPRPVKSVTVVGAKGHRITFYPDDLKALGSYLFARSNTNMPWVMNYRRMGYKCDSGVHKGLARNEQGLIADRRCNDVDAGVFYLTLVNRVALDGMGFNIDVDNNLKINNHPVSSYATAYFNPVTGEEGPLKDAMAPLKQVDDVYASRRNKNTKYLVGVSTTVTMKNYSWPEVNRHNTTDSPSNDEDPKVKTYTYDLELDAMGNILGGEWGDRTSDDDEGNQPDFIWMADTDALPVSQMAAYATPGYSKDVSKKRPFGNMQWAWDGKSKMPDDWMSAAQADETLTLPVPGTKVIDENGKSNVVPEGAKNSTLLSPLPLSHIVYYLFDQARDPRQQ